MCLVLFTFAAVQPPNDIITYTHSRVHSWLSLYMYRKLIWSKNASIMSMLLFYAPVPNSCGS